MYSTLPQYMFHHLIYCLHLMKNKIHQKYINVEILKGIKEGDKIKVWNSVEDEDEDEARRRQDENSRELED